MKFRERMLRDRLKKWGLSKNMRSDASSRSVAISDNNSRAESVSFATPSASFEASPLGFDSSLMAASGVSEADSISPPLLTPTPEPGHVKASPDPGKANVFVIPLEGVQAIALPWSEPIPRPLSIPHEELPRQEALRSIHDWFDHFQETSQVVPWDFRNCPMLDLMDILQEACDFLDTGSVAQGRDLLVQVGENGVGIAGLAQSWHLHPGVESFARSGLRPLADRGDIQVQRSS